MITLIIASSIKMFKTEISLYKKNLICKILKSMTKRNLVVVWRINRTMKLIKVMILWLILTRIVEKKVLEVKMVAIIFDKGH